MFSFVCHNVSDILTVFDDFEQAIGYGFVAVTFAMQSLMKMGMRSTRRMETIGGRRYFSHIQFHRNDQRMAWPLAVA